MIFLPFPVKCYYMQIQNFHNNLHINNWMETRVWYRMLMTQKRLTCAWGGFHRMFLSGAGVKPDVPAGLFFSSSTTPLGSSLSLATRFFNCQPTCSRKHTQTHTQPCLGVWKHQSGCFESWGCVRGSASRETLTTVCWFTWITSSPAWILRDKSAGD